MKKQQPLVQTKTYHCTEKNITVYYNETQHHYFIGYDKTVNDIQLYGNSHKGIQAQDALRFKTQESEVLSQYQNKLYKDAIHGLKNYSQKEIENMPVEKRKMIEETHFKTQKVLNVWKQSLINNSVDSILKVLFPNSRLVKKITDPAIVGCDEEMECNFSFSQLKINRTQIINKLIQEKILPVSFYSL